MMTRRALRKRRLAQTGAGFLLALVLGFGQSFWLGLAMGAATLWLASRHVGVPVMVYHSVSDRSDWLPWADNIAVRPEVFSRHMKALARSRWHVVPSRALLDAQDGSALPKRAVVLHFDDAYLDFRTDAMPILKHHGFAATVFASSDFIDPSEGLRDRGVGYMNADELRDADAGPLIEVACHGKDHARVTSGPGMAQPRVSQVWGKETAWLWSLIPGDKSRWFEMTPPDIQIVPQNDSSLCAQIWSADGVESPEARDARVTQDLSEARTRLGAILGRETTFLCWPFDRCDPTAVANARAAGFTDFTGGETDNVPSRGPALISRTHVNDNAAGGGPLWIEAVVFRAKLEVAAGNLLWWPVTSLASFLRKRRFAFLHGPEAMTKEGTV